MKTLLEMLLQLELGRTYAMSLVQFFLVYLEHPQLGRTLPYKANVRNGVSLVAQTKYKKMTIASANCTRYTYKVYNFFYKSRQADREKRQKMYTHLCYSYSLQVQTQIRILE